METLLRGIDILMGQRVRSRDRSIVQVRREMDPRLAWHLEALAAHRATARGSRRRGQDGDPEPGSPGP